MNALQLLSTGRANLYELLCSLQFSVVRVEHRTCPDVLRPRLGEFGTVHLRDGLTLAHTVTELS